MESYKCKLCGTESSSMNDFYSVFSNQIKAYECIDEKKCRSLQPDNINLGKKIVKQYYSNEKSDKTLSREDLFKEIFKLDFDELDESPIKFRDATINYIHKNTGDKYRYHRYNHSWSKSDF